MPPLSTDNAPSTAAHHDEGSHGLLIDLQTLLSRPMAGSGRGGGRGSGSRAARRQVLHWLTATGAVFATAACGDGSSDASGDGTADTGGSSTNAGGSDAVAGGTTGSGTSTVTTCSEIPTETEGPYPADGTQSMGQGPGQPPGQGSGTTSGSAVNALTLSGIVRSDIRTSLTGAGTTAQGVPVTLKLKLVSSSGNCANLAARAIYVWHCDRDGNYSLYSGAAASLDYLRGVQVTDANGEVSFTTIFPACYDGRWPHIHFEIYSTLTDALDSSTVGDYGKVSQLALPEDVCRTVYENASGYANSIANLSRVSLATDNVFSDDRAVKQLSTVTGSIGEGYVVSLTAGIPG